MLQIANFEETLAVLKQSPPDRIGHGTFLHRYQPGQGHEEIEDIVLANRIPIGRQTTVFQLYPLKLCWPTEYP